MNRKSTILVGLVILALLMLAAGPVWAAGGTEMDDAIEIDGVMQGTLTPLTTSMWFTYWDPGSIGSVAFTLNFYPANSDTNDLVNIYVWAPVKTFKGWEYVEVGKGTSPRGGIAGEKYWRGGEQKGTRYYVMVKNWSRDVIHFAVAQTGAAFPPPGLHVNVGGAPSAPAPVPTAVPTPVPTVVPDDGTPPTLTPTPVETRGKKADDAIPLGGTKVGFLAPYSSVWYLDNVPDANIPVGIDLNYSPADSDTDAHVLFKVWAFRNQPTGPSFQMIGIGTKPSGGMEHGMKFWRGSASKSYTVYIEVVNDWDGDLAYGIANVGTTFPPPQLPVGTMPQ